MGSDLGVVMNVFRLLLSHKRPVGNDGQPQIGVLVRM